MDLTWQCFGYRRRRRFRVSTRRCPLPPLSASSSAKNQLIQISVKQHLGREWQPPVPRLTTALLFLTLPPLLDLVGWSITLSGSVGCPGPAQVTSSQQLKCNCVASFFVPAENELIEFFEGVCIQSVHFTRDRCTIVPPESRFSPVT